MSKRTLILLPVVAALAVACSTLPQAEPNLGSGVQFLPQVADFQDNVGAGASLAVSADGSPSIAYFGFPQVLKPGQIAVPRPVSAPMLPAVNVASLGTDGIWTRGAVAEAVDQPKGVPVPYGAQTIASLTSLTPQNANGTDIAVDSKGGVHVVWAGNDGIWYAAASSTAPAVAEQVYNYGYPIATAGPIGTPSVALDDAGVPWVAYTTNGVAQEVRVATKAASGWTTDTVASIRRCNGCAQPGRTEIAVTPSGPVVLYVDQSAGSVMAARLTGGTWSTELVESGATGAGLSVATDQKGKIYATYDTGDKEIHLATSDGGAWATSLVGTTGTPTDTDQQTGVAVDDAGKIFVTWVGSKGVQLVSGDGQTFSAIATRETAGGRYPAVGVTPDGSKVFLAWYQPTDQDLDFGTYADTGSVKIAAPSPAPSFGGTTGGATCDPTGSKLTVTASTGAASNGFDPPTCLAVVAGKSFTLTFQNNDSQPGGIHNVSVYTDSSAATQLFSTGAPAQGPITQTVTQTLTKPGTFFFRCDVHTTTMVGTFIVK